MINLSCDCTQVAVPVPGPPGAALTLAQLDVLFDPGDLVALAETETP